MSGKKARLPKEQMVSATLDLLCASGLSGAGINRVISASKAPKGSLYHYFPGGKNALVEAALDHAKDAIGGRFAAIFELKTPLNKKIESLFANSAAALQANRYSRGCPVAAVTLDLGPGAGDLREVCERVFAAWVRTIAERLVELPAEHRRPAAEWILATLEGALVLARAWNSEAPLLNAGRHLGIALGRLARRPASRRSTSLRRRKR